MLYIYIYIYIYSSYMYCFLKSIRMSERFSGISSTLSCFFFFFLIQFHKILSFHLFTPSARRISKKEDNHITITSSTTQKYLSLLYVSLSVQNFK